MVFVKRGAGRPIDGFGDLGERRILIREMMSKFILFPEDQVDQGEIRQDGLDADIAKLCGLPLVQ